LGAQVLHRRNLIIATGDSDDIFITLDGMPFQCPEDDRKTRGCTKYKTVAGGRWLQISSIHGTFLATIEIQRLSNGKMTFQSFFMSTTIYFEPHPPFFIGGLRPI